MKYFISCIVPNVRRVGITQFEATSLNEAKAIAEELAPCRCEIQLYKVKKFDERLPTGEFISKEDAVKLGY
jgi:hypothetical protein